VIVAAKVGILGGGELGRQVERLIAAHAGPVAVQWFDDVRAAAGEPGVVALRDYAKDQFARLRFHVAIGYRHLALRLELLDDLARLGRATPRLVHPTAWVAPGAQIAAGAIVYPACCIDERVDVGRGAVLHNRVTLSHDTKVGACAYLSPAVTTAGRVTIGARAFLGTGVVCADGVTIGDGAVVGIGTVVTSDVPPGRSAIGNPMRLLDHPLDLH
jgi:sugar O-acyltransferase (sialic acid O-acetyltransferase NeuD family)